MHTSPACYHANDVRILSCMDLCARLQIFAIILILYTLPKSGAKLEIYNKLVAPDDGKLICFDRSDTRTMHVGMSHPFSPWFCSLFPNKPVTVWKGA